MKKILIIAACWFVIQQPAKAQVDAHFTQYYMYPLFLNPALTGVISDGDVRGTAIYRNQWSNIATPFSTVGVSGDMLLQNNWGLGINLLNQMRKHGFHVPLIFTIGRFNPSLGTPPFAFGVTNRVDECLNLVFDALERTRG